MSEKIDLGVSCPKCSGRDFERPPMWRSGLFVMNTNPLMAINELVLGQRVPKDSVVCKNCPETLTGRGYVFCPHCKSLHNSAIWSGKNAFGHWFGIVCPSCSGELSCHLSLTSRFFLLLTSPLSSLIVPKFRPGYWKYEQDRAKRQGEKPAFKWRLKQWLTFGVLGFGLPMSIVFSLLMPLMGYFLRDSKVGYWREVLRTSRISFPLFLMAGLFAALWMRKLANRQGSGVPDRSPNEKTKKTGS